MESARAAAGKFRAAVRRYGWRRMPRMVFQYARSKQGVRGMPTAGSEAWDPQAGFRPGRSPEFKPFEAHPAQERDVLLAAFYLPQFHPIPENDAWWGRGFTEWTNVARAVPQFVGHDQPRLPAELGHYDLRVPEVQRRQVELARNYGVGAFCFYYYWFSGKRLLEGPTRAYLDDPSLDLPFFLCWANENWTRRWDGRESDLLLGQAYSDEDPPAFVAAILPYLRDPRYVRVDGKPLLLVYKADLVPGMAKVAQAWRDAARAAGLPGLYLAAVETAFDMDVQALGVDATCEFPPALFPFVTYREPLRMLNPGFNGTILDYQSMVETSLARKPAAHPVFRGVAVQWDNTARRGGAARIVHGSTPARFGAWLRGAVERTRAEHPKGRRLVFVNAWNEWAEGTYLEPDQTNGYAYLQACHDALE